MLEDKSNGALQVIKDFAKQTDRLQQLQDRLDYLANYGQSETRCRLYSDFAPHSLGFVMERKDGDGWRYWFNGGLIYHGSHDDRGKGGWSVHT